MTRSAISCSRDNDFNEWYQEVVVASDLAEHSPVRGCMVIKPWGCALWERIQSLLDKQFKSKNVSNIYCPMLIPMSFLEKEAEHVSGFAKECAVVTHHRLELGADGKIIPASPLTEPYVIRPTSEAIIGHVFSKWIQSHRDLPLLVNQWANVMRWEMRPRLFLRTSEFLWQEGHTAHSDQECAKRMTMDMIECYRLFFENILAIPVLKGEKTAIERFSGALSTWTVEAFMQDGKALQAGTSHFLGQNFSRAFDIKFSDQNGQQKFVWTTSWGVSTRMIGAVVMSHGDDNGLVLPPSLSPYQIVIIPVIHNENDKLRIIKYIRQIYDMFAALKYMGEDLRIHIDSRQISSSDKKWCWIKRGVPLRVEIGIRDVENLSVVVSRRDNLSKDVISLRVLSSYISSALLEIQKNIWDSAFQRRKDQLQIIKDSAEWLSICNNIIDGKAYLVPWAASSEDEQRLSKMQLSIRCLLPSSHPFLQSESSVKCVVTGKHTDTWAVIAKSY